MSLNGMCILKGVECKENMVQKVAELIAPVQSTIYGDIFDVKVEKQPINIAYTDSSLDLHMDLMYYESPPGLQFLHCIKYLNFTQFKNILNPNFNQEIEIFLLKEP